MSKGTDNMALRHFMVLVDDTSYYGMEMFNQNPGKAKRHFLLGSCRVLCFFQFDRLCMALRLSGHWHLACMIGLSVPKQ